MKSLVNKFTDLFSTEDTELNLESEKAIIKAFENKYRELLKKIDLSIFKIDPQNISKIKFNEEYRPVYNGKELKNLGSASDQARIIFPYILALMDTSIKNKGNHPGFVVVDEPIQQNPDEKRRPALIDFLTEIPQSVTGQVIIFTYLFANERATLREKKIKFHELTGPRFLKAVSEK